MSFVNLRLADPLLRAIADQGYAQPTPIQAQTIPLILAGRDLLAAAQTGTGKTAAFALPLLQRLSQNRSSGPNRESRRPLRALVLTPTRELAAQVGDSFRTYGRHLAVRTATIFGGVNIRPQIDTLRRGVDILVATPGRLLDHVQQRTISLANIEILILDEADRMLDMGFIPDIRRILALLPRQRQNLLFSATFPDAIRTLADGLLHQPAIIDVAPRNAPAAKVSQQVHPVERSLKPALLAHLVQVGNWRQTLVFTRTKHGANRLAQQLERDGISATAIHGNKSQAARTRALADFKQGKVRVLVATDIAARGLDIQQLPQVVNYDLPHVPEDYVHRIGRTGRAEHAGAAVSLVCADEAPQLRGIQRLLGYPIPSAVVEGFAPDRGHAAPAMATPRRRPRQRPGRQAA
ncbi:MAG TPA: DEAD/DEAH box helicase [Candidatus Competibacteraceae bacterium]|nr:DEAD/DEAH box helicase [Candidatus Competibacteraceae bacterium]